MSGEFERIARIAASLGPRARGLGDDCAIIPTGKGRLVVSTDASIEGTHFRLDWIDHREAGWRAAASALSDLAAEAATPAGVLAAVVVPAAAGDEEVVALMDGVGDAAAAVGAHVVGGDLSQGPSWAVTVTVLGWAQRPVTRAGARPGDGVWVTGTLGASRAALEAWKRGDQPDPAARAAFAHPVPRIGAGLRLADAGATALLDISDGLGGDAQHLADSSHVAIVLDLDAVPVSPACHEEARRLRISPQRFAADGGEDYELLVALPPSFDGNAARAFRRECRLALTRIGSVGTGSGLRASLAGREVRLSGYDHFR
ncbi:MAG TPA: thiamine-phosphate kinase [Gemmatimonadales bacterium]